MITLIIISIISFFTYCIIINLPSIISKFVPKLPIRRKFISLLDGIIDTVNPNSAFYTETGLLAELEAFKSRDVNDPRSSYSSSTSAGGADADDSNMLRVFQLNMLADGLFGLRADLGNCSCIVIIIHNRSIIITIISIFQ